LRKRRAQGARRRQVGMSERGTATTGRVLHAAGVYDLCTWVLTLGRERPFRERLVQLARLATGESVLDVGCGTGGLAMAAKADVGPGGEVCGIDPSPEMVARARRKAARGGDDVRFETAAVEALPFPDGTFDAVLSSLMLHHLSDEGRREGVSEIARVLRPGGRFLGVDIGGGRGQRHGLHFLHVLPIGRHAHFDLDELTPLFEGAGFRVVEQGPVGPPRVLGLPDLKFVLMTTPAA
jgi:ubiquinone/menaquinone biosynthesis C-methylase UbiE